MLLPLLSVTGAMPLYCWMAAGESKRALQAARQLTTVGQTSGWDLLAGLLGSLGAATSR